MGWLFRISCWLGSCLGAIAGAGLAAALDQVNGPMETILWSGCLFLAAFAGGFLGLQLSLALNRRWRVHRPPQWPAALALSAVLLFGAGAGGQALFMISRQEAVPTASAVDLVLLLDASSSMDTSGYSAPRTDAATQFVEALDEDVQVQAVSFAAAVIDATELLPMDDTGKAALRDFIAAIDSVGNTDFNAPLDLAVETLADQARSDASQAILLLTDGEGDFSDSMADTLTERGIRFFSIRIAAYNSSSDQVRALQDLAADTGGFDTRLDPGPDGSVDTADMLTAFQEAFQAAAEGGRLTLDEDLLISSEETSLYQFVVRLAVLALCAVLFGTGYFGRFRFRPADLAKNALSGAAAAIVITLAGQTAFSGAAVFCVLAGAACVTTKRNGGETLDV